MRKGLEVHQFDWHTNRRGSNNVKHGMSRTKAEDCNKRKLFDEVQAHQFDWHTTEGLIEDLSSHCNGEDYLTKNVSEQIDLLLKKYRTLSHNRRWPCHLRALQSVLIIKTWT